MSTRSRACRGSGGFAAILYSPRTARVAIALIFMSGVLGCQPVPAVQAAPSPTTAAPTRSPSPTAQPTPSPVATPAAATTATSEPVPTDDPSLIDPIISALRSGEPEAIRPYIGFKQVPCSASPRRLPACASDERDGQQVDTFYVGACEGDYVRPADMDRPLRVMTGTSLYAVYRLPPDKRAAGQYSAILIDRHELRLGLAWEAIIDEGRIVALIFSCAATPQELIKLRHYTDAILPP